MKLWKILFFLMTFSSPQVVAAVKSFNLYWLSGDQNGELAATCQSTTPDERPFQIPKTLVIDNSLPIGTEVYKWNYGEFVSDIILSCTSSGISNSDKAFNFNAMVNGFMVVFSDIQGAKTGDGSLVLKLWVRLNKATASGYKSYIDSPYVENTAPGTEYSITSSNGFWAQQDMHPYSISGGRFIFPTYSGSISMRASLVKAKSIDYISYTTGLSITGDIYVLVGGYNPTPLISTGNAINIAPPACRLKTNNYNIDMGRWAADTITHKGSPTYGSDTQVKLLLECSGKINNVNFKFQDTGTSPSFNNNISLYDSLGGTKIDGLEIELRHNGSHVDVDNIALTNTGSHGQTKTQADAAPEFDSTSTASFTARYVQHTAIKRAGIDYIGPVTGHVNMFVTYN